ncbi:MAG: sigma-70 family RNA polymerase sigma factor [Bacteroidota bacterium]
MLNVRQDLWDMRSDSSKIIWDEFTGGSQEAFSRLYSDFYPQLIPYAKKICKEKEMALDAVHNTFLNLWQNRESLKEVQSVKFYLLRSVRHECIRLLKIKNLHNQLDEEEILRIRIEPNELVLTDLGKRSKARIKQALEELSDRQREIIYLKYFNNLDYEEIAGILNLNYQSIVNSIHRSIKKLRESQVFDYLKDI